MTGPQTCLCGHGVTEHVGRRESCIVCGCDGPKFPAEPDAPVELQRCEACGVDYDPFEESHVGHEPLEEPPGPEVVELDDPADDDPEDAAEADEALEEEPQPRPKQPQPPQLVGKRQKSRSYDWPAIKRRYVEGVTKGQTEMEWPSLDAVAAHFGVNATRVREKSAQEGWRAERTAWQAQMETVRRQARANALSKEAVNLETTALSASKTGLQLVQAKMQEVGTKAAKRRQDAGIGGDASTGIDALELTRLATAADVFHKIGLRALGDPDARVEVTGAGGGAIEIQQELRRDDPNRIAEVLSVLRQAGLGDLFGDDADARRTLEAQRGADGVYSTEPAGG